LRSVSIVVDISSFIMNSTNVALFVVVMVAAFQAGTAIHCYVCNSGSGHDGTKCGDPFDSAAAAAEGLLKDCSNLAEDVGTTRKNNTYTMCRKFYQDVEGDVRVVRTCATAGRPGKCIDRTGTAKIKLQYCECENNSPDRPCNTAQQTVATSVLMMIASCGLVVSHLFWH